VDTETVCEGCGEVDPQPRSVEALGDYHLVADGDGWVICGQIIREASP
jgi:hypothetical protein